MSKQHDKEKSIGQSAASLIPELSIYFKGDNQKVILIIMRSGCQYCTLSASFYRSLLNSPSSKSRRLRFIAIMPDQEDKASAYLKMLGLSIPVISNTAPAILDLMGTPTILEANSTGVIEHSWTGMLSRETAEAAFREIIF